MEIVSPNPTRKTRFQLWERLRAWSLLLLATTVRSFVHMPLEISDRNNTKQQHMLAQNISQCKKKLFQRLKFFTSTHSTVIVKNRLIGQISQLVFRKRNKNEKTIFDKRWLRRSTHHEDPKDSHSRVVFTFALQALQALTKKKTNEQNFTL